MFDKVWGFIAATNLICLGIDSLDDDAGEFCNETVQAVGTAAISYYTGLPPRLTTSAELEAAAEGSIEDAIRLALETGLGALNLSCDTFTLNSTEASDLVRAGSGGQLGAQGTSLSGCDLFAQTLGDQVSGALQARTATILGQLIGRTPIPGLVMSPISDRLPLISITAPADSPGTLGSACPVVINTTVTEQFQATRTSFRFLPVEATLRFNYGTATGVPGVSSGATAWRAEIPVGALPQTWWKPQPDQLYNVQPVDEWEGRIFQYFDTTTRLIEETPADSSVPYLSIAIDSPCFVQTYVIEASKYDVGSGWFAFVNDTRPAVGFW